MTEDKIYFKSEALTTIEKRINGFLDDYRQNIALLGKSREDLKYVLQNLIPAPGYPGLIKLRIDTGYLEAKDIIKNLAQELLRQYLSTGKDLDFLLNSSREEVPLTTAYIKTILKQKQVSFLEVIELINKFINETGAKCVLLIEEFPGLFDVFGNFCGYFTRFIMMQKNCMIIMSSFKIKIAENILGNDLNLLFGNFEKVFLEENSVLENSMFFIKLLEPLNLPLDILGFFVNLIPPRIDYYRAISREIKKHYCEQDKDRSLIKIAEKVFFSRDSILFNKFINRIETLKSKHRDFRDLIKILSLMSQGYFRKDDLALLSGYEKKKLNTKLQKLIECGEAESFGNIYKIADPLFSFWITNVFRACLEYPLDPASQLSAFENRMKEEIAAFKDNFYKEKIQKIFELFSAFNDDTVILRRTRIKLPSLEKIKIIAYPDKRLHLLVGEGEEIVFVGIKEDATDENDIINFTNITEPIKNRNLRKIFISLGELNYSARVLAEQSKVLLWDYNRVNKLLKVYDKPFII